MEDGVSDVRDLSYFPFEEHCIRQEKQRFFPAVEIKTGCSRDTITEDYLKRGRAQKNLSN